MKKILIHLSDLHFRNNWEEDQGIVLEAFFKDLSKQIQGQNLSDVYIVFSGDVVLAGSELDLYENFLMQFNSELQKIGIVPSNRVCIPGNHDVSRSYIKNVEIEHEGIILQNLNENKFNDFTAKRPTLLFDKFNNYLNFEPNFSSFGITAESITGRGWDIDENIGLYCLNTALCSSGGHNNINDKGRLAIDTRSIHKWLSNCTAPTKVLVMHHPVDWLTDWAQVELKKILKKSFSLCLSGHVHDQSLFHSFTKNSPLVECSAPPLLTNKKGDLGYSIITISVKGVEEIAYRQWTKNHSFVTGVNFSDTDDGKIILQVSENASKKKIL